MIQCAKATGRLRTENSKITGTSSNGSLATRGARGAANGVLMKCREMLHGHLRSLSAIAEDAGDDGLPIQSIRRAQHVGNDDGMVEVLLKPKQTDDQRDGEKWPVLCDESKTR